MSASFTTYIEGSFSAVVTRSNHVLTVGSGHGKSPCFRCRAFVGSVDLAYGRLFSAYLNIAAVLECA
jgi:hypothetical protein